MKNLFLLLSFFTVSSNIAMHQLVRTDSIFDLYPVPDFQVQQSQKNLLFNPHIPWKIFETLKLTSEHLNMVDDNGDTLLHIHVRAGNVEIVKKLLKLNADQFKENKEGHHSIELAFRGMNEAVIRAFMVHGAFFIEGVSMGDMPKLSFQAAIHQKDYDTVKMYLKDYPDLDPNQPNYYKEIPLIISIGKKDFKMVEILLADPRINVKNPENNPLDEALHELKYSNSDEKKGLIDIIRLLLDRGCLVSENAYALAARADSPEVLDMLQVFQAPVNQKVLHFAAGNSSLEAAKWFLREKITDINLRDAQGNTPLHYAAKQKSGWLRFPKDLRMSWLLWRNGGNLDITNNAGLTPKGIWLRRIPGIVTRGVICAGIGYWLFSKVFISGGLDSFYNELTLVMKEVRSLN